MKVIKGILLVMLMFIIAGESQASEFKEKSALGKSVNGIQLRLSADSTVLKFGEIPNFKCDVLNNGPHKWKLPLPQRGYQLEVDGQKFTRSGKVLDWKLLKRGDELSDVAILGDVGWNRGGMFTDYNLALRPGKHTIRLGVIPKAASVFFPPKPALCMSNPITVEVVAPDGMVEDAKPIGMTVLGEVVKFKLDSWDSKGGKCGINFGSERVISMPADIQKASESKRFEWMREQGVDAVASISEKGHGLIGIDLAIQKFDQNPWSEISAEKAQELKRDVKVTAGKISMLGPLRGSYRHHYVVKTRDGKVLQLDIDAGHNRSNFVEFSYKTVLKTVNSISVLGRIQRVQLKKKPAIDKCSGISIDTADYKSLHIRKDGSAALGSLNCSSAAMQRYCPAGTFNFEDAYNLAVTDQNSYVTKHDHPYRVDFHIPNTPHDNPAVKWSHCRSSFGVFVTGNKQIAEIFKKADAFSKKY